MSLAVVLLGVATGLEVSPVSVGADDIGAAGLGDWIADVLPGTGGSAGVHPLKPKPSKPVSKTVA